MRKLDFDKRLSQEDIAWMRQAGFVNTEDIIRENAERFGFDVPTEETPEDTLTRETVGPDAIGEPGPEVDPATGAARRIDPTQSDLGVVEDDDYDQWKKPELEAEVKARNEMADTTGVEVVGTGRDGAVLKEDLIKALRLWDQDNPDALKD